MGRKSMIAGLTLSAVMLAFAGPSHAYDPADKAAAEQASVKPAKPAKPGHGRRSLSTRTVVASEPQSFRIPAHPIIRDCIRVQFPQCTRGSGLNDGTFGLPY
jgi:hypothetical protein